MSPVLGDMRRQGCPKNLECESDLEVGPAANGENAADENEDASLEDYLQQVLWVLVRDFPSSVDVALRDTSGMLQDCAVLLPNCGSFT